MYDSEWSEKIRKIIKKMMHRDPIALIIIKKKSAHVIENPSHYKNLRAPLEGFRAVHIDSHFVLLFSVDENRRVVRFIDYAHHDDIYLPKRYGKD